jgi:hypothetical protein
MASVGSLVQTLRVRLAWSPGFRFPTRRLILYEASRVPVVTLYPSESHSTDPPAGLGSAVVQRCLQLHNLSGISFSRQEVADG